MSQSKPNLGLVMANPKAYDCPTGERFVLRIEARTDGVPGMWDNPADLMQWLCTHPYIQSVKLLEYGPQQHVVHKRRENKNGKQKERTLSAKG